MAPGTDTDTGTSDFRLIGDDGTEHLLAGEQIVGRSEKCEITIDSPRVSRQHATFTTADDAVTIEDLGSANGTFVNGAQITTPTVLRHADRVCFEKHCFKFHGIVESDDDDDADVTMIGLPPDDSDVTVISSVPDVPTPAPAPPAVAQAPAPVAEAPQASAAPLGGAALPGAWVDDGTGDQTRFLDPSDAPLVGGADTPMDRSMDSAHLILKAGESLSTNVLELTTSDGDAEDIWEIGRDGACQVVINDGAVSERHAQLVHKGGRWRIVNLVSTNGLFVNDERRLKAYLDDGDRIRIGTSTVAFYAAKGAARPTATASATSDSSGGSKSPIILILAGVAVAAAIGAWFFLG